MSRANVLALGVAAVCLIASVSAQPAPGPGGGIPAGAAAGRGTAGVGFNGKHAQDQLVAIQGLLEVGDEEWKSLSPQVEKVITAKQNMSSGAGMKWMSANNARPRFEASDATPATAPGKAMQALREVAAQPEASKDEISGRVAAMRQARQKARADYDAAQQALLGALTPRQEAILMTLGVLD